MDFGGWKFGIRYKDGKLWFFKADKDGRFRNPVAVPDWAVDIREIIAMVFAGVGGLALLFLGNVDEAMLILVGLLMYATGRTVPQPKYKDLMKIVKEMLEAEKKVQKP